MPTGIPVTHPQGGILTLSFGKNMEYFLAGKMYWLYGQQYVVFSLYSPINGALALLTKNPQELISAVGKTILLKKITIKKNLLLFLIIWYFNYLAVKCLKLLFHYKGLGSCCSKGRRQIRELNEYQMADGKA